MNFGFQSRINYKYIYLNITSMDKYGRISEIDVLKSRELSMKDLLELL